MTTSTTEPIPADVYALYEHLRKLTPGEQCEVADRLSIQLGGTPEAIDRAVGLVGEALGMIAHGDLVDQLRAGLAENLADAADAITAAMNAIDRLPAGDVYDVEYAEGGQRVADLRTLLADAGRFLRAAAAANPCPPAKNGTDQ